METLTAEPKRGNPNFGKRKPVVQAEENKVYEFELVNCYPNYVPVDRKTEKPLTTGYPVLYGLPNEGVAYDEETKKARAWRLIEGQPSIWVDEQPGLESMDKKDIYNLLAQQENQLDFRHGKLMVRGLQKLRFQALTVQDEFEGKKVQYKPKQRTYRLNNPDADIANDLKDIDREYLAMKLAMETSTEAMIQAAFVMGINVDDLSDTGLNRIKKEFLTRAKYDPKNPKALDWFTGILLSPTTKINYIFSQGLSNGIISANQQPGKLTWAKPNTVIMDINSNGNVVDQMVALVLDENDKATKVLAEIENQLNKL